MPIPAPLHMIDLIRKKRDGGALDALEIAFLVAGAVDGSIPPEQLSAWLMAAWLRGLSQDETRSLTLAMRDSGEKFSPARLGKTASQAEHSLPHLRLAAAGVVKHARRMTSGDDLQGVVEDAEHFGFLRVRRYAHRQAHAIGQRSAPWLTHSSAAIKLPTNCRTSESSTCSTSNTTSGDKSKLPISGRMRRTGRNIGSPSA